MDFAKGIAGLKLKDADYHILMPVFSKVLDEVYAVKDKKKLDPHH
jgi:hypothetical protein